MNWVFTVEVGGVSWIRLVFSFVWVKYLGWCHCRGWIIFGVIFYTIFKRLDKHFKTIIRPFCVIRVFFSTVVCPFDVIWSFWPVIQEGISAIDTRPIIVVWVFGNSVTVTSIVVCRRFPVRVTVC